MLVDDLSVRKDCGGDTGCVSDAQCAVNSPCLEGFCDPNGECDTVPLADCCTTDAECPSDTCAQGVCDDGECRQIPVDGCCADDSDCPPTDGCEGRFTCNAGQCIFDLEEIDCDDNNVCTADTCDDGNCQFAPIPGCGGECLEDIAAFGFEGSDEGWTFDDPVDDFGWRRVTIDVPGQPQALYFGNPFAGPTGDPGFPLESAATSAPLTISPLASAVELNFQLFSGFANFLPTDELRLEAVTAGQSFALWTMPADTSPNQPVSISVDASVLIGSTFQLRFVYASLDNIQTCLLYTSPSPRD